MSALIHLIGEEGLELMATLPSSLENWGEDEHGHALLLLTEKKVKGHGHLPTFLLEVG